jgi:hypothetical protein
MRRAIWTLRSREVAPVAKAVPIGIPALAALMVVTVLTAAPAQAQTYNPDYPVCLQTYGRAGGYIDCRYFSLAQCGLSASGRAAQCIVNPYFAGAEVPVRGRDRRHRRVY